jgi:hypothetical protein
MSTHFASNVGALNDDALEHVAMHGGKAASGELIELTEEALDQVVGGIRIHLPYEVTIGSLAGSR